MLNIAQVCDQYARLYTTVPAYAGTWDHLIPTDGCYVGIAVADGISYVNFRGSVTFVDWLEDSFAEPMIDPVLGSVHPGFTLAVRSVKNAIDSVVAGTRVVAVGHSLGAGHALIYAALRTAAGLPVDRVLTFGSPRPGGSKIAEILNPVARWSFRNGDPGGHDLVTDVPFAAPPLLDYEHPTKLTDVSASPRVTDSWGPFRYHHFGLYCQALGATSPAAKSLPT